MGGFNRFQCQPNKGKVKVYMHQKLTKLGKGV